MCRCKSAITQHGFWLLRIRISNPNVYMHTYHMAFFVPIDGSGLRSPALQQSACRMSLQPESSLQHCNVMVIYTPYSGWLSGVACIRDPSCQPELVVQNQRYCASLTIIRLNRYNNLFFTRDTSTSRVRFISALKAAMQWVRPRVRLS